MIGKTFVYKIEDGFLVGIVQKIIEKYASVYFTSFIDQNNKQKLLSKPFLQRAEIKNLIQPNYA